MNNFDILKQLLESNRSIRRFDATKEISHDTLLRLIELTRFCASGRNAQPLKYRIVTSTSEKEAIFPTLAWAGYYPDWDGPEESERPAAYLIQCLDTSILPTCLCDDGIQLEAISLGARALGIGGCIIKAFNQQALTTALELPDHISARYVLALGYPKETVKIEDMDGTPSSDYKYYRDEQSVHHVPKRPLSELVIH